MLACDVVERLLDRPGRGEPCHFVPRPLQFGFRVGEKRFGRLVDSQCEGELAHVVLLAKPPVAGLLRERVGQVGVEVLQRGDRLPGGRVIGHLQIGGHRGAQRVIDQRDIAVVLLMGDVVPDLRRVNEVRPGLVEQRRQLFEALDDVAEAPAGGRVVQDVRAVQRVAGKLDVDGRVVSIGLDRLELEERQADRVVDDLDVGLLLLVERRGTQSGGPVADARIEPPLGVEAGGAVVVQRLVQRCAVVVVVTSLRGRRGPT